MSKRYEHSPIIEALCQFQFEPNSSWDLTVPGLIYERVQKVFPKRNQVAPISLAANPGVVGQALPLMQFISEDEKSLIQVGQDLLTVSRLYVPCCLRVHVRVTTRRLTSYRIMMSFSLCLIPSHSHGMKAGCKISARYSYSFETRAGRMG